MSSVHSVLSCRLTRCLQEENSHKKLVRALSLPGPVDAAVIKYGTMDSCFASFPYDSCLYSRTKPPALNLLKTSSSHSEEGSKRAVNIPSLSHKTRFSLKIENREDTSPGVIILILIFNGTLLSRVFHVATAEQTSAYKATLKNLFRDNEEPLLVC